MENMSTISTVIDDQTKKVSSEDRRKKGENLYRYKNNEMVFLVYWIYNLIYTYIILILYSYIHILNNFWIIFVRQINYHPIRRLDNSKNLTK